MSELGVSETLTVQELAEESGLGIRLVAGAHGAGRSIEAVYIGDLEDPTPWMIRGSLLLTTGPTFAARPESAATLVRLLKERDMVAVGVAITPHVDEIPDPMIDAADEVGLPVLRIPPETPFRTVTSYVFNALTSWDMHRLRRSLAMQNRLLQVLLEEDGEEGLVGRLAEFLDGVTLLFDSHGHLLASSSRQPAARGLADAVWEAYYRVSRTPSPGSVLEIGESRARFREARVDGAVERVLVTVQPLTALVSEYDEAALTFAQRLIEVELHTQQHAAGKRRRTRATLLEMLVHGRGNATELAERLLPHGITPSEPWRILVLESGPKHPAGDAMPVLADGLDDVDAWFEEQAIPFLSSSLGDQIVVLSSLSGEHGIPEERGVAGQRMVLKEAAVALSQRLRTGWLRIGCSEPLLGAALAPVGLAHARQALDQALVRAGPAETDVVVYEDLGLRRVALDLLPTAVLESLRDKVLGSLEAVDEREGTDLAFTLRRYLAHDCSIAETSRELFLHRNTLRKRLARIERVVGLDLALVDDVVEAYLSVQAAEVARARET